MCSTSMRGTSPGNEGKCLDISHWPLDPQEVERYLRKVYFQGLTGRISFDSSGDPVSSSYDIRDLKQRRRRRRRKQNLKIAFALSE